MALLTLDAVRSLLRGQCKMRSTEDPTIEALLSADLEALSRLIRYASQEARAQGLELTSQALNRAHQTMVDAKVVPARSQPRVMRSNGKDQS
jgi:hypothetical protein